MKDNKEFIEGVYKKYEEYQDGTKFKKVTQIKKSHKKNLSKILSIAAMTAIVVTGISVSNNIRENEIKNKISKTISSNDLTLKKVENFENLYKMAKENIKVSRSNNMLDYSMVESESFSGADVKGTFDTALTNSKTEQKNNSNNGDYSRTNIQVQNVDEADVVKTDGKYIYYIAGNKVVIVNIEKQEQMVKEAEIRNENYEFNPSELYINDNKLIVIGNESRYIYEESNTVKETQSTVYMKGTYKPKTVVIIYDLANIKEPKETRKIEIDGNYLSSRMIDNNIYFIANNSVNSNNLIKKEIEDLKEEDFKPSYMDTAVSQKESKIDFDDIYYYENFETLNYLSLAGFNINSKEEVDVKTFLGAGEDIYSSSQNMYIAKSKAIYDVDYRKYLGDETKILKFNLDNGKINFKAEVNIAGKINNQFSMDENEKGEFRVATTIGDVDYNIKKSKSTNSLFILDENLNEISRLDGIAPGEKIYSVRYTGDKAYMVTFYEMDPLFVIDLSDSKKPKILGELKIPGYSSYLHPYDENHLIGFGYDTKANYNGTGVVRDGLKMSMFDITDFKNPKEMFTIKIGDSRTYSELTSNHKALLFSKEKNFIAFPTSGYEGGRYKSKAQVYNIDLEKGFSLRGEIEHDGLNYMNQIKRIIYSKDIFYTLSQRLIKATDMNSLKEVTKIDL
ncbi:MAG: beta-propeller domain-containing protein [Clostridia bacterium]|nr:beta-propeller domain-containing protein [Clostridia bacterium]